MTSFGVAPALVMYEWILNDLGRWGWLAAFVYVAGRAAAGALQHQYRRGRQALLPGPAQPAAAALVAGFVWLAVDNKLPIHDSVMAWVAFTVTMYAGISMVSNAPFFSGKSFALGRSVPFWGILLVVAVFVFVSSDPPVVLFGLFVLYGLSGWIIWALRWNRARRLQQERRGQGN